MTGYDTDSGHYLLPIDCFENSGPDHDEKFLRSNETGNAYGSSQPQQAFNSRIEFCLEVRNDAVKGMQYPPNAHKERLKKMNEEAKKNEDELAAEIEEGKMDEDDEDDEMP